jgi:uncharacterized membrane protein SirB2
MVTNKKVNKEANINININNKAKGNFLRRRYQIGDCIVDFIHFFWAAFFLFPLGTISMGPATVFGSIRQIIPVQLSALIMFVLAATPMISMTMDRKVPYVISRLFSVAFYFYLGYLCVLNKPYSTGMIYFVISCASLGLAISVATAKRTTNTNNDR